MADSEMMSDTSSVTPTNSVTTESPFLESLWKWLIAEPWRVAVVAGIPCVTIILIAVIVGCCCMTRSKKGYHSASSRETVDDDADSKDLPSVINGALEMVTIDPFETVRANTAEAAHPAVDEMIFPLSADSGASFLGEQDESSTGPFAFPTGGPTDGEQRIDTECSLVPQPRSFKQRRTSSTSSQQKSLAYVEVELKPVTEENKNVIIATEKPTQYAKIAGVYKPFSPK